MMSSRRWLFVIAGAVGASAIAVLIYSHHLRSVGSAPAQILTKQSVNSGLQHASTTSVQSVVANGVPRAERDWAKDYRATNNYFDFMQSAAKAALAGDSRAALYISKALYVCSIIRLEYANSNDPQSDFSAHWATRSHAPQWAVDKARKDFQTCAGFIKNDPFADLPAREGGYNSIRYWIDKSSSDPVAQGMQAGSLVADANDEKSDDVKAKLLDSAKIRCRVSHCPLPLAIWGTTVRQTTTSCFEDASRRDSVSPALTLKM
jgi:hypothetical protein